MWAVAARELLQPIILSLGTLLAFSHEVIPSTGQFLWTREEKAKEEEEAHEVKVVNNPAGWKNDVGDEYDWQGFFDQYKDIYPWKDKTIEV